MLIHQQVFIESLLTQLELWGAQEVTDLCLQRSPSLAGGAGEEGAGQRDKRTLNKRFRAVTENSI